MRTRRVPVVGIVLLLAAWGASCGSDRGSGAPTAPSSTGAALPKPTSPRGVTVTLRVFDSSTGELAKPLAYTVLATKATLEVPLADVAAVDINRKHAAVYTPHSGHRLGDLVTSTTNGVLTLKVPLGNAEYDLFVMHGAAVNYDNLNNFLPESPPPGKRYVTMRLSAAGEQILGVPTYSGPDVSFRHAAEELSRALNPFGLEFGRVDYVEAQTADVIGAWGDDGICGLGLAAPGLFWVNRAYRETYAPFGCYQSRSYVTRVYGGALMLQGLVRSHLQVRSPAGTVGLACLLVGGCSTATLDLRPTPPLDESGKAAVRYWALMNGGLH